MRQHSQCTQPANKTEYGKNAEELGHRYTVAAVIGTTTLKANKVVVSPPEKMSAHVREKACVRLFIAVLSGRRNWKKPKCPSPRD